jgi:[protein-PII] uridylyltransferase
LSSFLELTEMARSGDPGFAQIPKQECVEAAREFYASEWARVKERHAAGESGSHVLHLLTEAADAIVSGVTDFGLYAARNRSTILSRISICALGGYGRCELSPRSDLDVCLLYDGKLDRGVQDLNAHLMPFLWDMGFQAGYTLHSVAEAMELAEKDPEVYTTYAQARLILGDATTFARLRLLLADLRSRDTSAIMQHIRVRERPDELPPEYRDLYNLEPDIKENVGGLRDYHAAMWMILLTHGAMSLDDLERLGHIPASDCLDVAESLNFLWRIRNELHFATDKPDNRLTFALQKHVAQAFGYGPGTQDAIGRLMQDYYAAAQRIRWFFQTALRICEHERGLELADRAGPSRSLITVYRGQLCARTMDSQWFAENPARLMELIWECARRQVPLSYATECWVTDNLFLVSDTFRSSDVVRRYFVAICSKPMVAGHALRQAARTGLLGAYIPEFQAVQGIVRYEDFHSYPVDEHTLRALESLAEVPKMQGAVGALLQRAMEHLREPHLLVLAILFHDLGKASGEIHVEEGVRLARAICARIGVPDEDGEHVAFLVKHHMLMVNISFYRDTDGLDIVTSFAQTMKTADRLRELLLLSYADLSAVGPNVWNEWKGALLLKLFLKAESILLGRSDTLGQEFWTLAKAEETAARLPEHLRPRLESHLRVLGERYFFAFPSEDIVRHLESLEEAEETGLGMRCVTHEETGMSEVVVCTRDRRGLFAKIAGSFTSQLVDVQGAALFTKPDGWVVDCFTVRDAANGRPLTDAQFQAFERVLRAVLIEGKDVQVHVDQARRRLFALLQPRAPVPTHIRFDNESSATDTVIDVETGDRTGLLYDMARALSIMGVDISSARIMTDARRVRDSFYVRVDGAKLEDRIIQVAVRAGLMEAIQPVAVADNKGGMG